MTDYSNSHKSKQNTPDDETPKQVERVVKTEVVVQKKSSSTRLKTLLFGTDAKTAATYVVADVVLPAVRKMIFESISAGAERMLYGDNVPGRRPSVLDGRTRVSYNMPPGRRDPRVNLPGQPPRPALRTQSRQSDDLVFGTREEAELVVTRLIDIVDQYQVASVADLYDLVGLPSSHVDQKWGWTYLTNTQVRQVRNGFLLELPPLEEI